MITSNSKQRLNTYVNPIVVKRAKAQALVEGTSVSEIVERALIKHLPVITKIEFISAIEKDIKGGEIRIEYDEDELRLLEEEALLDVKTSRAKTIRTKKELNDYLDKLEKDALNENS